MLCSMFIVYCIMYIFRYYLHKIQFFSVHNQQMWTPGPLPPTRTRDERKEA